MREFYRNPSVLVLDEATSSLDLNNEAEITKTISNLKGKKTIIIVSHRIKIVKNCDKIFRMENGTLHLKKKLLMKKINLSIVQDIKEIKFSKKIKKKLHGYH